MKLRNDYLGDVPITHPARFVRFKFILALLVAVAGLACVHVMRSGGQFDGRVYRPFASFSQLKELDGVLSVANDLDRRDHGQRIYGTFCASCHLVDGRGSRANFVPPLAGSDWVTPRDPARIIRVVLDGLSGPITVNNEVYGQTTMVPWRDLLRDEDIAAALTYVRSSWGNHAPSVRSDEVKRIRDGTSSRRAPYTEAELLRILLTQ